MIADALAQPFFVRALIAGLLAAIACGVIGSFVVVKRIASISGSLSHAAFGGVGLGYLLGFSPILGATAFALIAGVGIGLVYRRLGTGLDTPIAMVWSVGMALGMFFVALTEGYAPDLLSYLFGSILYVTKDYLLVAAALDGVILVTVLALFRPLTAVVFDEEFAEVMGLPVGAIFQLLLALVALAVVTLIQLVGVILVIALLTFPAAIARQWVRSMAAMMAVATVAGAAISSAGLLGAWALSTVIHANIPTGPSIILTAAIAFGLSSGARRIANAAGG